MNFRLILNIMGYTLWVEAGCLLLPLLQTRAEARFGHSLSFRAVGALWPVAGFLLSFALIASRETVPFLYFQF